MTMDSQAETGQISTRAAEVYAESFEPVLFAPWAPRVADAAGIEAGMDVLDVASGPGVLAAEAARRGARTTAVDINEGMLAVGRRLRPGVRFEPGDAEALPLEDDSFDRVVSQFGLMFFPDPVGAVREMGRVLRPGGRLAVAVWTELADTPGYAALAELLESMFGTDVAAGLRTPFALGERVRLQQIFAEAGVDARLTRVPARTDFGPLREWVSTEVRAWTYGDAIDDAGLARLLVRAERELARFVGPGGTVTFATPAWIATA